MLLSSCYFSLVEVEILLYSRVEVLIFQFYPISDTSRLEQARSSGVIGALNSKMPLHTARRIGLAAFRRNGKLSHQNCESVPKLCVWHCLEMNHSWSKFSTLKML